MANVLPQGILAIPFTAPSKLYRMPAELSLLPASGIGPSSVRLDIDWSASPYNARTSNPVVAVEVDIEAQMVQPIDAIRSVYIDNSNSITPIYVVFPDTGFLILCPPRSVAWQPVLTSGLKAKIFGVGFVTNLVPVTPIYFSNINVAGYINKVVGANLVRGQFIGAGSQVANALNYSVLIPNLSSPAPDRLFVAAITCINNGTPGLATPTSVIVNNSGGNSYALSPLANTIGVAGALSLSMWTGVCPLGASINSIDIVVPVQCRSVCAGVSALYNVDSNTPFETRSSFGAPSSRVNISPFATEDGYVCIAASERVAVPGDTVWTNALENAQINADLIEMSIASIDVGSDNYVPVIAETTQFMLSASFN